MFVTRCGANSNLARELRDQAWPAVDEAALGAGRNRVGGASVRQIARPHHGAERCYARGDRNLGAQNLNMQKFIAGQTIKKIVVVPGRLVNVVV